MSTSAAPIWWLQPKIHPEHLGPAQFDPTHSDTKSGVEIATTVTLIEALGATSSLYTRAKGGARLVAECHGPAPQISTPCCLRFAPSSAHLFRETGERFV